MAWVVGLMKMKEYVLPLRAMNDSRGGKSNGILMDLGRYFGVKVRAPRDESFSWKFILWGGKLSGTL